MSRAHPCSQCDYVANSSGALTQHELVHSRAREYICPHCGSKFGRNWHLTRHMRMHDPVNTARVTCHSCMRSFTSHDHLIRHTRCNCPGKKAGSPASKASSQQQDNDALEEARSLAPVCQVALQSLPTSSTSEGSPPTAVSTPPLGHHCMLMYGKECDCCPPSSVGSLLDDASSVHMASQHQEEPDMDRVLGDGCTAATLAQAITARARELSAPSNTASLRSGTTGLRSTFAQRANSGLRSGPIRPASTGYSWPIVCSSGATSSRSMNVPSMQMHSGTANPPFLGDEPEATKFDAVMRDGLEDESFATRAGGMDDASFWDDALTSVVVPELPSCREDRGPSVVHFDSNTSMPNRVPAAHSDLLVDVLESTVSPVFLCDHPFCSAAFSTSVALKQHVATVHRSGGSWNRNPWEVKDGLGDTGGAFGDKDDMATLPRGPYAGVTMRRLNVP